MRQRAVHRKKTFSIDMRQRRSGSRKTAEERFHMLARGWLAYPVTPIHSHLPPKSGCRNVIPRLANNLYNRSSAVDPSFYNQPQVGKPTWGYNYPTALRRLPSAIGHHPQKRPHPSSAISPKPAIIICLRQRRNAKKTAEERFNMLARGWLAYPVTSIHSHLPPSQPTPGRQANLGLQLYNRPSAVVSPIGCRLQRAASTPMQHVFFDGKQL